MIRRHLDAPVYDDSEFPLKCSHCSKPMDAHDNHASHCRPSFGTLHRDNNVHNVFPRHVPNDVTDRSPYVRTTINRASSSLRGAAEAAEASLQGIPRSALSLPESTLISDLTWDLVPLAFDHPEAYLLNTFAVIDEHARRNAFRSPPAPDSFLQTIRQRISFAIWSSVSAAILCSHSSKARPPASQCKSITSYLPSYDGPFRMKETCI